MKDADGVIDLTEYNRKLEMYSAVFAAELASTANTVDFQIEYICRVALDYAETLIKMQEERKKE